MKAMRAPLTLLLAAAVFHGEATAQSPPAPVQSPPVQGYPLPNQPYGYPPPNQPYGYPPPNQPYGYPLGGQPTSPGRPEQGPVQASPQPPAGQAPAARLTVTTPVEAARTATLACIDALDNYRLEAARELCGEAVAKDPQLALAHALLAEATLVPDAARKILVEAQEALSKRPVSDGERLLVLAIRAMRENRLGEARRHLDTLCSILAGEPRVLFYRGRLRQRVGDMEGALADYRRAVEVDDKFGPGYNALGYAHLARGQLDEAKAAFERYVQLSPKEANAYDSLAEALLRRGEVQAAAEAARKAVELDGKFLPARAKLGDALLFLGKGPQARREYGVMEASADAAARHEGAMRTARSYLFEGPGLGHAAAMATVERALLAEAEASRKAGRRGDQIHALMELARLQVERNALADAGHTVRTIAELLERSQPPMPDKDGKEQRDEGPGEGGRTAGNSDGAALLSEDERVRWGTELLALRALMLVAIGEPELAEARVKEMEARLKGPAGRQRVQELRGDLAARSGDARTAVALLDKATRPTLRLALALALAAGKAGEQADPARARAIMEELSRRTINDLEGALSRSRARSWLKANPAPPSTESRPRDV
ncbi:MAG: tetratricopeptide repeat protein [Myxococcota bacterium]|nr:tetratricopeptide repeat protein [Myxococcota bacterium]